MAKTEQFREELKSAYSFKGDTLTLSTTQRKRYEKLNVHQIYPEYWIIKAGVFNEDQINDELDEWIYFLKTGEVLENFTAEGLEEARNLLDQLKLDPLERSQYKAYIERVRKLASYQLTEVEEVKDLVKQAEERKEVQAILGFYELGINAENIAKALKISINKVENIIKSRLVQ